MRRVTVVQQLAELFDSIIVSAAEGVSKESKMLFGRAIATAKVHPARSVFTVGLGEHV